LEVVADAMDVLGSGVMGLTFKCARCHTHKFDPIPQRDYYRLIALLKGAYDEHDWLKPQVMGFGGALSAGFGDRFLPYVATEERQRWEAIQNEINQLSAMPKTPEIEKRVKELETSRPPEPKIMALWDRGEPTPTFIYRRGDYLVPGSFVTPGVPAVLSAEDQKFEIVPPRPDSKSTGRRLALANWLTDTQNPLTARVIVNRQWKHHFGTGLVRSVGNFGKTGDRPTHPELLDYLSYEFMHRGWSFKDLHRRILNSATYQQSSHTSERIEAIDPANRLLSRMPLRRLDAEEIRDAILFVADELIDSGGGPSEPVQVQADGLVLTGRRRSVYVQRLRKHPPSLLESFDFPAMNPNCLQRSDSLVPTQALHLMNDAAIRRLASRLAERISSAAESAPIEQLYWITLGRKPSDDEVLVCSTTLNRLKDHYQRDPAKGAAARTAERMALSIVCHTILNSAEFLYVD
jgi:hypothetical protein